MKMATSATLTRRFSTSTNCRAVWCNSYGSLMRLEEVSQIRKPAITLLDNRR